MENLANQGSRGATPSTDKGGGCEVSARDGGHEGSDVLVERSRRKGEDKLNILRSPAATGDNDKDSTVKEADMTKRSWQFNIQHRWKYSQLNR